MKPPFKFEVFFPSGTTLDEVYDYCFFHNYWPECACQVMWLDQITPYLIVSDDGSRSDGMS